MVNTEGVYFPFYVFTHCFVPACGKGRLRTKCVLEDFSFGLSKFFQIENLKNFLFEKICSNHLVIFLVRLLAKLK
jgi:hypothetical protein